MTAADTLAAAVRDVPDFPKPGILFKDITPVLSDGKLFRLAIETMAATAASVQPDLIAGIDARGFIFGAAVAEKLGIGFVPVRKKGKLPYRSKSVAYALEYGEAVIEVHEDAFPHGERVVLMDDLLATGGTAAAACELIRATGGNLVQVQFLIELSFLGGRKALGDIPVHSVITY